VITDAIKVSDKPSGIFNLACTERVTLSDFYRLIFQEASIENPNIKYKVKKGARTIYPSVECGPIDISRAKRDLNFTPTKIVSQFVPPHMIL
jgi:nucleoside-diphosphate-sugar epimerase